ncbi:FxsB family cyclophane-forming radical SAM/SPASM peptide maturase [Acrocarpospora sp. B8E8]|uniref:FxsB family cyclophane-forming radical SAM/SPASM peptide maturase n=1 Tax=Acrocarpospora sp. B8E8 TaxID=3153572 RepID=UPI00325C4FDE
MTLRIRKSPQTSPESPSARRFEPYATRMREPIAPFRQFVLKIASRCDLACDHCYVYESVDQSWRGRPMVMADATIDLVAARIAEHSLANGLGRIHVVIHGGEPLLAGVARLRRVAGSLRAALPPGVELDLRVHSNGVLLSRAFCEMFAEEGIKVGISLDGDRAANDRHRRYANGNSSFDKVVQAIDLLRHSYAQLYAGLLCTVDVRNDPIAVYEALLAFDPPRIDFLLPHATWQNPPPRPTNGRFDYADWLGAIHMRWVASGRPVAVRMFDSIAATDIGGTSQTESLGISPSDLVVIETDGAYEQADSLKATFDGAPSTGMNVADHSLDEVVGHPGMRSRQLGIEALADECRRCPIVESCGGGLYAHRWHPETGFKTPSVYCADLKKLIPQVQTAAHPRHELPISVFQRLASLSATPDDLTTAFSAQRSLVRQRVAGIGAAQPESQAWQLLGHLDRLHRPAVARVLDYPYVRAWAARGETEPGHLAAVAAAAAVHAGFTAEIAIPAIDGHVHLPGIGRMSAKGAAACVVRVRGPGDYAIHAGDDWVDSADPAWEPVRRLTLAGRTFVFDDLDAFRDCYDQTVADRLDPAVFRAWAEALEAAWARLGRVPRLTAAVATGLSVITPLSGAPGRGASSRSAFGALALSEPLAPETTALMVTRLAHSAQAGALLDGYNLVGDAALQSALQDVYGTISGAKLRPLTAADLRDVDVTMGALMNGPITQLGREFLSAMSSREFARHP